MSGLEWWRAELLDSAEEDYRNFHQSLVPGLNTMLGVRMPKCREIAKKIAKQDWSTFLEMADDRCYEELMLQGLVTGYAKMTLEQRTYYLERFVPKINNWAICDCSCSTFKFMKQEPDYWISFLKKYIESGREFEVRFAVVSLMDHFMEEKYLELQFEQYEKIFRSEFVPYYIQMAVSWGVSACYVHFPEQTEEFLRRNILDVFTHNKAIQKIRESYRVPGETKEALLQLKR